MAALLPPFRVPFAQDDGEIAAWLLAGARREPAAKARIDARATGLIDAIRSRKVGLGGIEELLREYSLSTREGLALMVLAEALLRVPDAATADRLIEDKLGQGDFAHHESKSDAFLVSASAWALGITARVIQPGETPTSIIGGLAKRLGMPTVRTATRQAMRVMGNHFVLGQTIEEALKRAGSKSGKLYRYSFDMLGEGARTQADADRYFASYAAAIDAIGRSAGNAPLPNRPGISVKLSALHPRYDATNHARVLAELTPKVIALAQQAKRYDLNFTIDAEEADRLELSLDIIDAVVADPSLADWDGFGLAIQAYQKRASAVIDHIGALAESHGRRMMVRLVKGAYWDTELKRAQERGLPDYPVFTRKAMTDLNYEACAAQLLALRPRIIPQFATHNAQTVATVAEMAGSSEGFEFQRLHGMGEALYEKLLAGHEGFACRTYAPVGGHQDLLAYLVRRLLENGANSSFVSVSGDPDVPVAQLLVPPADIIGQPGAARHRRIPLPADLFGPSRKNSAGVELGHADSLEALLAEIAAASAKPFPEATPIIDGASAGGAARDVRSPIDNHVIGRVTEADSATAARAMAAAKTGFPAWNATPARTRAAALRKAADLMEARRGLLLALLQAEAGKTLDDAVSEVREAVDFCRYYAAEAESKLATPTVLPGPTGEDNRLILRGRGAFLCIAPWNFPLAIFAGQIAAALVAGNSVVAKPAPQTPLIAAVTVRLLHEAGIPTSALHLVPGDGAVGAALVAHKDVAGVAFTGSTTTARAINRALAAKDGPIVPLIAETGGLNAMIVDATALAEQVADDVVMSAFRSAGQRCSALRLLVVQDDVADKMIEMITGAARELKLGDPRGIDTHIGPVIDGAAKHRLDSHIDAMRRLGRVSWAGQAPALGGTYVAPHVVTLGRVADLASEHFGPILHVVRWKAGELDTVIRDIEATGYGLTLGVHSRIETTIEQVTSRLSTGNIYVNRNIIGAVVGVQPFGGHGLSGTGPKAGGPHYLMRFATEQTVTVNTAAAGGNASLIAMGE
ncbi:bifunctional proline dehydrogenase/L-glutamate gamma-semialdehyde dehydrogenase PutA [Bosea sp. RAC05]|jgi:RHH-type proline utilization regulon transcriptional repressor/proline dehydrogenase/delta 1-pyrroline-5-carboxylate dehydrogenase|uniref:bifunctional proline dehydrogenase/L-glutamate gamma-semialdehyde dehydrogenase PutA n=1 Tax=Bosea sp. RAC05 TaxID=1842539 RepID=UPI00083DB507|nr:bifunctional proline dehydrogenase/L-glutamate gamma-semialdehyde dehydrogenase PutA [Bosea sp. RAC05]AOG07520.1 delta-1-pyrroline-5-carboxylate dehydrogenase [Bosea sp. RAC05]